MLFIYLTHQFDEGSKIMRELNEADDDDCEEVDNFLTGSCEGEEAAPAEDPASE